MFCPFWNVGYCKHGDNCMKQPKVIVKTKSVKETHVKKGIGDTANSEIGASILKTNTCQFLHTLSNDLQPKLCETRNKSTEYLAENKDLRRDIDLLKADIAANFALVKVKEKVEAETVKIAESWKEKFEFH